MIPDMEETNPKKEKKVRTKKTQYIIWWRPNGGRRREYGPVFDIKTAKRDALFYQQKYGENNGGWEIFDPNQGRPRRNDRY